MPGAAAGWAPPPVADGAAPTTAALPPHESQQKVSTPCRGAQHLPSHCCRLAIPAQMACGVWWRQSECSAALSRCGAPAGCERCQRQHRCPPHPHQPGAYVHAKPGHPGQPQVRCSCRSAWKPGSCCASRPPSVLGLVPDPLLWLRCVQHCHWEHAPQPGPVDELHQVTGKLVCCCQRQWH